ncbi:DEAD (Asp-Glu-Ala-Asp) box polypeptide 41 family protein, partial [Toxoplasma gondii ARI]
GRPEGCVGGHRRRVEGSRLSGDSACDQLRHAEGNRKLCAPHWTHGTLRAHWSGDDLREQESGRNSSPRSEGPPDRSRPANATIPRGAGLAGAQLEGNWRRSRMRLLRWSRPSHRAVSQTGDAETPDARRHRERFPHFRFALRQHSPVWRRLV